MFIMLMSIQYVVGQGPHRDLLDWFNVCQATSSRLHRGTVARPALTL